MTHTFPRSARVRTRREYAHVFDQARRVSDPLLSLHWCKAGTGARLGLAVSRKVSTRAVMRNRIKRTLREQFRQLRLQLPAGDYVVVARHGAAQASPPQLRAAFHGVLVRAGALPATAADGTMPPATSAPSPSSDKPAARAG